MDDITTTLVGIIGDDPLTSQILGLLLEGAGYETSPLEEAAVLEDPSTALAGVDLVLFMPLLGDERKGELLGVMKGDQATATVPILNLSTDLKAELDGGRTRFYLGRGPRKPSCGRSSGRCMRPAANRRRQRRTGVSPFLWILASTGPLRWTSAS